jgi:phage baseplate assembly protein W
MPATTYNIGFKDDEAVNNSSRSNYIYKDLNLFFSRNPVTGDVSTVSDVQNIKRAVRNLVLLNTWDKPFHPEIGTNVRGSLFENFTPIMVAVLREKIEESIKRYEPRVTVTDVSFGEVEQHLDNNELRCTIEFTINNVPERIEEVELMLQRIR